MYVQEPVSRSQGGGESPHDRVDACDRRTRLRVAQPLPDPHPGSPRPRLLLRGEALVLTVCTSLGIFAPTPIRGPHARNHASERVARWARFWNSPISPSEGVGAPGLLVIPRQNEG